MKRRISITFINKKGGVGKTTLAFNLAGAIADTGESVLLIDGDMTTRAALAWQGHRDSDKPLPFDVCSERLAPQVVLRKEYSCLVLDTKAAPQAEDLSEVLQSCDLILVPTFPDATSLGATLSTLDDIAGYQALDKTRVLINGILHQATRQRDEIAEGFAGRGVASLDGQVTYYRSVFPAAAAEGLIAREVKSDPTARAWEECQAMAQQILALAGRDHG